MSLTDTADPALPDAPLLRLFDVLFTTHSVTRTAEQLGLSQPTVSIWLAKLRTQLHDPLFVRTSSGMQPTPRARELIAPAREALAALRRLSAQPEPFDPAQSTRRFRLCMTEAGQLTLLPMLAAHVRALAPGVSLETGPVDAQTADALASGDADLALGFVPWLEAGLYQQSLFAQDWVCLVHPQHPRVAQGLTLRQYKDEAHVGIVEGTGTPLLDAALERHRVQRRLALELSTFLGLPAILSATDLVATLPRHTGETLAVMGGLTVHPCPVPVPSFVVKQHWPARLHQDAAHRWLREAVAALFLREAAPRRRRLGEPVPAGDARDALDAPDAFAAPGSAAVSAGAQGDNARPATPEHARARRARRRP